MPELPEVETVARGLAPELVGQTIAHVQLNRADLRFPFPIHFAETLTNRQILAVRRRAKYVVCELSQGYSLLIHLGMSGKLVLHKKAVPAKKHDHVIIQFGDGKHLIFNDARRFGLMDLSVTTELDAHPRLAHMGVEPLTDDFNGDVLFNLLNNKTIAIKQAIMNAELVVGVGNIYASEALFRAKIHPKRASNKVTKKEAQTLSQTIKQVLNEAIESGGSTLRDYVRSSGELGYFQHRFNVYDRENEPCTVCSTQIERIVQTGRSTYFCPSCQKQ